MASEFVQEKFKYSCGKEYNQTYCADTDSVADSADNSQFEESGMDCNIYNSSQPFAMEEGFQLEQGYLGKLTKQRLKIEELSQLYRQNQEVNIRLVKENEELKIQNDRLSHMAAYYHKFEELKREYQVLLQNLTLSENQIEDLKGELQQAVNQNSLIVKKIKTQYKKSQNKQEQKLNNLEQEVNDKEDQISKIVFEWKSRQQDYQEEIERLNKQLKNSYEELQNINQANSREKQSLANELCRRESEIFQIRQTVDLVNRRNNELQAQNINVNSTLEEQQEIWKINTNKLKTQLQCSNREVKQKENSIVVLKQSNKRTNKKLDSSEDKCEDLLKQLKKLQELYETKLDNVSLQSTHEFEKMEKTNRELKLSLQELVQMKNQLLNENRNLIKQIKKRDEKEKQRRVMLRNEMREIDKLERVVEKML